jgi:hypothetical protein
MGPAMNGRFFYDPTNAKDIKQQLFCQHSLRCSHGYDPFTVQNGQVIAESRGEVQVMEGYNACDIQPGDQ